MLNSSKGLGGLSEQRNKLHEAERLGLKSMCKLKELVNNPDYEKQPKSYTISDVERITGIPRSSIRDKEKNKKIKYLESYSAKESKKNYTISNINSVRSFFGKGFFNGDIDRPKTLPPITLAISMFKGGVGKTTHSTHLAVHLCLNGLKVLLVDLDPQASASFVFSYIPSVDLENGQTILSSLLNAPQDIKKSIRKTYYDGLDIITSGLELQSADLLLPNNQYNNIENMGSPLLRLKRSLDEIRDQYDIIILDCAPNHAATTMNALAASDGIIIPISPNMLSYGSSIQFIHTLKDLSESLLSYKEGISNDDTFNEMPLINSCVNSLFRILITNDPGDKEAQDVTDAIRGLYGNLVLPRPMCQTISLSRSANDMSLLYDIKRSEVRGSKEAYDRGMQAIKAVNDDIMILLRNMWELDS